MSTDAFPPDLMAELSAAKGRFLPAYDYLWRNERLLRYVYWLNNGTKSPTNCFGSWVAADMIVERDWWLDCGRKRLELDAVANAGAERLKATYGIDLAEAVARGSDGELAKRGLPVWDTGTDALVPAELGPWKIRGADSPSPTAPHLGASYHFRHSAAESTASLYLYSGGEPIAESSELDSLIRRAFDESAGSIQQYFVSRGGKVEWAGPPKVTAWQSSRATPIQLLGTHWLQTDEDGSQALGSLSMTIFRASLLKVRLTLRSDIFDEEGGSKDLVLFRAEVADFVLHFGP